MEAFVIAVAPALRYIMLAIVLFVTVRMLIAMFSKKVSDPVRAKLVNTVSGSRKLKARNSTGPSIKLIVLFLFISKTPFSYSILITSIFYNIYHYK